MFDPVFFKNFTHYLKTRNNCFVFWWEYNLRVSKIVFFYKILPQGRNLYFEELFLISAIFWNVLKGGALVEPSNTDRIIKSSITITNSKFG